MYKINSFYYNSSLLTGLPLLIKLIQDNEMVVLNYYVVLDTSTKLNMHPIY